LKEISEVPIGVSFGRNQIDASTTLIYEKEFDNATSTEFFTSLIWQNINDYDFSGSDEHIDFCRSKSMNIHAHCLLYPIPSVSPDFLVNFQGDNIAFELLVKDFLSNVLTRYKGKIKAYDLTNELFAYNSGATSETWMRNRFPSDSAYFDFVGRCYQYAHAADPDALLFYNDYGQEFSNNDYEKGRSIATLLKKWKQDGIPVHGYGLQLHTNIYRPIKDITKALEIAVSTGLKIHISELDIAIDWADFDIEGVDGGEQNLTAVSENHRQRQKQMYYDIASAYCTHVPPGQQYGITLWDTNDKFSFLTSNNPLEEPCVFDKNNQRKPLYYGLLNGLSKGDFNCQ
jgi:endo-1,4-beta-xylanase